MLDDLHGCGSWSVGVQRRQRRAAADRDVLAGDRRGGRRQQEGHQRGDLVRAGSGGRSAAARARATCAAGSSSIAVCGGRGRHDVDGDACADHFRGPAARQRHQRRLGRGVLAARRPCPAPRGCRPARRGRGRAAPSPAAARSARRVGGIDVQRATSARRAPRSSSPRRPTRSTPAACTSACAPASAAPRRSMAAPSARSTRTRSEAHRCSIAGGATSRPVTCQPSASRRSRDRPADAGAAAGDDGARAALHSTRMFALGDDLLRLRHVVAAGTARSRRSCRA